MNKVHKNGRPSLPTTLAAIIAAALAFTACGGSKPPPVENGNVRVSTPATELLDLANEKYQDHYFGIGDGVSTKESMAYDIASAKARNELALYMQAQINGKLKNAGLNSINDEAAETTMSRIVQETQSALSDVRIQKRETMYNKDTGKYTVYVLVSVPQNAANEALKRQVSNGKAISDAAVSKVVMDIIDAELDK
ncbi:MAG: hypothetical protein LBH25_09050 [Fibromonadaceae bacterium]|jgi:hypothetical protein|nr:hypothetical protein [Fibromonadaceae bacterium]